MQVFFDKAASYLPGEATEAAPDDVVPPPLQAPDNVGFRPTGPEGFSLPEAAARDDEVDHRISRTTFPTDR